MTRPARAELALAKKDFGGSIPHDGSNALLYGAGIAPVGLEAVALRNMWAKVGVHVSITTVPSNAADFYARNTTPFFANAWFADYPDPQDFAENLLSKGSPFDSVNYDNPAYERLMQEGDAAFDPTTRARIYVQAQRIALQDVAFIPVGQQVVHALWKPNVHGLPLFGLWITDWTRVSVS
jgi:peptide/nickel transport system substrate-binding protein/oligopeptide transport system substrate-binding protein